MLGSSWLPYLLRYGGAVLLVVAAFLVRLALDSFFGADAFIFSIFYLAVVLAAYFAGTRPAIVAAILSALAAYWAFATPEFAWKINTEVNISMGFFALTSAVDIYFITGMKRAMHRYRLERTRAEILAQGHAALFHEYNERTASHLQMLASLLKNSADQKRVSSSEVLAEASRRTMLLSSVHRNLSTEPPADTHFVAFARQMLDSVVQAAGSDFIAIKVEGEDIAIPADRSASMAVILFEWARFALSRLSLSGQAQFVIALSKGEAAYVFTLAAHGCEGLAVEMPLDSLTRQIIDAMTDHLGGEQRITQEAGTLYFELRFPVISSQPLHPIAPMLSYPLQGSETLQ